MVGLTSGEQRRNLTALNRLIELAHDRGIAVSLGIWDHIYRGAVQTGGAEWLKDYQGRPIPNTVDGVTTENLNAYTLASLKELLRRVPALDALQFRVHEESGLAPGGNGGFLARGLPARAKGATGHADRGAREGHARQRDRHGAGAGGEPPHRNEILDGANGPALHPTHINPPNQQDRRHGYADLLRFPQRYPITWRLWNGGTTRVLLWGDPNYVRRYSESTLLYDSPNWDVQEPLATKMEAQRPDMPTFNLVPEKYRHTDYEFERYWHFFQVWGRVGYNPATPAEVWQREFQRRFGPAAAPHVESGLHRASQVLPMIVSAVYPYRLFPTTRGWAERQSLGASLADYAKKRRHRHGAVRKLHRCRPTHPGGRHDHPANARCHQSMVRRHGRCDPGLRPRRGSEHRQSTQQGVRCHDYGSRILAQLARFHAPSLRSLPCTSTSSRAG
jgi:hypothetical protein